MKKLVTLIMVLSCIFSSYAFAAQPVEIETYASSYFDNYSISLSNEGDGDIKIKYFVAGKNIMDELGVKKIIIQEKTNSSWDDVKTYNSSSYSSFISKDIRSKDGSITYSGEKGNTYRAKVTFYAKDSSGSATKTSTSSSITV